MLRRSFTASPSFLSASRSSRTFLVSSSFSTSSSFLRFAGASGVQGPIDHSASMQSHAYDNAELKAKIDQQAMRTVPAFVPGKMFMRHWIAGVQAFESIYNRIVSLIITAGIVLWGSLYSSNNGGALNGLSATPFIMMVLIAIWLPYHTHHLWHAGVVLGMYAVTLQFGLL
jgi:hypothetical protein